MHLWIWLIDCQHLGLWIEYFDWYAGVAACCLGNWACVHIYYSQTTTVGYQARRQEPYPILSQYSRSSSWRTRICYAFTYGKHWLGYTLSMLATVLSSFYPHQSNTGAVNNTVGNTPSPHGNYQQPSLYDQGPGLPHQPPRSSNTVCNNNDYPLVIVFSQWHNFTGCIRLSIHPIGKISS